MSEKVLFVDDEPHLLSGLRRMLRNTRGDWDMDFALGGAEAVQKLQEVPFDVVVTDMRMPDVDGAALLQFVCEWCPSAVRIVLSGQCETSSVLRAVRHAHQYIRKPCDANELRLAVQHAADTRDLLRNKDLVDYISRLDKMFCMPETYASLVKELERENASLAVVGDIVSLDIGVTAKLLHLSNSSFYSSSQGVSDPWEAVKWMGLDTLRELTLDIGIFEPVNLPLSLLSLIDLTSQASVDAAHAFALSRKAGGTEAAGRQIYTSVFLKRVGWVLLYQVFPEQCALIESEARGDAAEMEVLQERYIGATESQVLNYLFALWGLPDSLYPSREGIELSGSGTESPRGYKL